MKASRSCTNKRKEQEKEMRYRIDLQDVSTKQQFHDRIQEAMPCPSYYGRNLDALYDVLTESSAKREIVFAHIAEFEEAMPGYGAALRELCEEATEECPGLTVLFCED